MCVDFELVRLPAAPKFKGTWISDMGMSYLCPKMWLIFTNLGQGLSQKVVFFLIFESILRIGSF